MDRLDELTVDQLLNKMISILSEREFIDVLLPWLSTITKFMGAKNKSNLNLNTYSNLIECLLLLLSDTHKSGGLSQTQR